MNSTQSTSSAAVSSSRRMFTTRELVIGGMFAALLAVISQLSIPMPSGVPITIQILGVALVGSVLGWRLGLFATITYILIALSAFRFLQTSAAASVSWLASPAVTSGLGLF